MTGRIAAWIKRDGLLHLETCALIAVAVGIVLPWWAAALTAMAAGVGKELWDTKHGVATWHDVICDLMGAAIGTIITLL